MSGYTLNDIARALSGQVVGNGDLIVQGAAEPAMAGPDQLAVAMEPKFSAQISLGSARTALLCDGADWQSLGLKGAVLVARPRLAMAGLTGLMGRASTHIAEIHPSAIIDPTSDIGPGARIGAYCVIGAGVKIGAGAVFGPHVSIGDECSIGDDCQLEAGVRIGSHVHIGAGFRAHAGVVIGSDGFSFVTAENSHLESVRGTQGGEDSAGTYQAWLKIHSIGGVVIGDNVEIGANSSVDAGTIRATSIGDGTKIDALVQVGHNVRIGRHCLLCAHVAVGGSAQLGNGVVLGGQAGVADNLTLGDGVIAGGGSKILSNVPAGRSVLGYPATKMDAHIESYKSLRRLPKFMRDMKLAKKSVSKAPDND